MKNLLLLISVVLLTAVTLVAQTDTTMNNTPAENVPVKVMLPDIAIFGPPQADFIQNLKPVLFNFDEFAPPTNGDVVSSDVQYLKDHPQVKFWVNGYADSRGDILYNMTLSQKRADTAKAELIRQGIAADRILMAVGWGKLYPICGEENESCWAQNRRVKLVYVP